MRGGTGIKTYLVFSIVGISVVLLIISKLLSVDLAIIIAPAGITISHDLNQ